MSFDTDGQLKVTAVSQLVDTEALTQLAIIIWWETTAVDHLPHQRVTTNHVLCNEQQLPTLLLSTFN